MAITKNQLKSIVKECLIEILAEGMGPNVSSSINESAKTASLSSSRRIQQTPTISSVKQQIASKTQYNVSGIKEAIQKESGGNSLMADILADTAAKTLPTMLENDRRTAPAPTGVIERAVANHSPEQLFGEEAASKWAALAFAEPINKLR